MKKNEQKIENLHFISGMLVGLILCFAITYVTPLASAIESQGTALGYPAYVNGKPIALKDAIVKDGKTYVQLRELCSKMNVTVEWLDPSQHMAFAPGGGLPEGINLTNPTFVYTAKVTDFYDTKKQITGVEITGIYNKYSDENKKLKYAFTSEGLSINNDGVKKVIPLKYNPISGRTYLSVGEFKKKVQPYLVDICMQNFKY